MQQREQIISELKRRGKRMTDQRKIMLDVILEGRWSSCKEIYYEFLASHLPSLVEPKRSVNKQPTELAETSIVRPV